VTKLAAALVDGTGAILSTGRVPTRDAADRPAEALRELVTRVAAPFGLAGAIG
jgi:predicted NBD/HSP70 family sugar kinase